MIRYYVKSPISGWHEVDEERYESFCAVLRAGSVNVPYEKKGELIASLTRIVRDDECCEIDLPDSVPGMTVKAPELPKVEIPEDWDI